MSRRELERWVEASRERLAARGITVLFGLGPEVGDEGGSSWASFISRRGSGRLVRQPNGGSRVDVYAYSDGLCLKRDRNSHASVQQLEQIADLLTPRTTGR